MDFNKIPQIAYFVSSHGFGHATRSAAVMDAIHALDNSLAFNIFSNLPNKFWQNNLPPTLQFKNHRTLTDVGTIQNGPFLCDLNQTAQSAKRFLQSSTKATDLISQKISGSNIKHVITDISVLGIMVSQFINSKCTLIENFTWDWIYQPFFKKHSSFKSISTKFAEFYRSVDFRIQTTPFCKKIPKALQVPPIFRKPRMHKYKVKLKLGIESSEDFTLISTGGIPFEYKFIEKLKKEDEIFVLSGNYTAVKKSKNLIFLPMHNDLHYPDIIHASTKVIGKVGYGTVVECWASQKKFHGIYRNDFRESEILRAFIEKENLGEEIPRDIFESGDWINLIASKNTHQAPPLPRISGNLSVAKAILSQF